jgi:hypothetical protein
LSNTIRTLQTNTREQSRVRTRTIMQRGQDDPLSQPSLRSSTVVQNDDDDGDGNGNGRAISISSQSHSTSNNDARRSRGGHDIASFTHFRNTADQQERTRSSHRQGGTNNNYYEYPRAAQNSATRPESSRKIYEDTKNFTRNVEQSATNSRGHQRESSSPSSSSSSRPQNPSTDETRGGAIGATQMHGETPRFASLISASTRSSSSNNDDEHIVPGASLSRQDRTLAPPLKASQPSPSSPTDTTTRSAHNRDPASSSSSSPQQQPRDQQQQQQQHDPPRSDSLTTVTTMPDPPSLRQGPQYVRPGAYRMNTAGQARMLTAADSTGASVYTQTTTITVVDASVVVPQQTNTANGDGHGGGRTRLTPTQLQTIFSNHRTATAVPPPEAAAPQDSNDSSIIVVTTTGTPTYYRTPSQLDNIKFRKEVWAVICCLILVFAVAVAVTVAVVSGREESLLTQSSSSTTAPCGTDDSTSTTTNNKLSEESPRLISLREALRHLSPDPSVLDDPFTPQYDALVWLADQHDAAVIDDLEEEDDNTRKRRLEARYALATLYYATNGEDWFQNLGFLFSKHECDWTVEQPSSSSTTTSTTPEPGPQRPGVSCNDENEIFSLTLGTLCDVFLCVVLASGVHF